MQPIRVVLADGLTLLREGTRALLERAGDIEVVGEAADGFTAIDLVDDRLPDVLLVDAELPELTGIEVVRRVKDGHPSIGVLILTAHDEGPLVFAAIEAGTDGYLLKDTDTRGLLQAIRDVHAGESVLHPAITTQVICRLRSNGDGPAPASETLSGDERAVLLLASRGLSNREISEQLRVSSRTVQQRLTGAFDQLGARSRTEAAIRALQEGVFTLADL